MEYEIYSQVHLVVFSIVALIVIIALVFLYSKGQIEGTHRCERLKNGERKETYVGLRRNE